MWTLDQNTNLDLCLWSAGSAVHSVGAKTMLSWLENDQTNFWVKIFSMGWVARKEPEEFKKCVKTSLNLIRHSHPEVLHLELQKQICTHPRTNVGYSLSKNGPKTLLEPWDWSLDTKMKSLLFWLFLCFFFVQWLTPPSTWDYWYTLKYGGLQRLSSSLL